MGANTLSYQFKSKQTVLSVQLAGGALFAINMFMLDAVMGGILNLVAILRAVVYMHTEQLQQNINRVNASIGGILCEIISLFSIISARLRLDINKSKY